MREKPILFSAPMVRAILEGRKTQTRLICNPQPFLPPGKYRYDGEMEDGHALELLNDGKPTEKYIPCPTPPYQPGDRMWVQEPFSQWYDDDGLVTEYGADTYGRFRRPGWSSFIEDHEVPEVPDMPAWSPSIHMPRAASRITLEVTDVRVERVQDISRLDTVAEGLLPEVTMKNGKAISVKSGETALITSYAIDAYAAVWNSLYAGSWEANPWVWVFCFKVLEVKK